MTVTVTVVTVILMTLTIVTVTLTKVTFIKVTVLIVTVVTVTVMTLTVESGNSALEVKELHRKKFFLLCDNFEKFMVILVFKKVIKK